MTNDNMTESSPPAGEQEQSGYSLDKFNRLNDQFSVLLKTNKDLEERLLLLVEKSERDKLLLSQEIDELSSQLQAANMCVTKLQSECARYKSDCVLATHLLHCQPSHYVSDDCKIRLISMLRRFRLDDCVILPSSEKTFVWKKGSNKAELQACGCCKRYLLYVFKLPSGDDVKVQVGDGFALPSLLEPVGSNPPKRLVHVSSFSFPPTAVMFDCDQQLENATKKTYPNSLAHTITGNHSPALQSDSLQDLFIEKVLTIPQYQSTQVIQCSKCGRTVTKSDKATQLSTKDLHGIHEETVGSFPLVHSTMFSIGEESFHQCPSRTTTSNASKSAHARLRDNSNESQTSTETSI